jgi:hypothetical protein
MSRVEVLAKSPRLTAEEMAVLTFERCQFRHAAAKEGAIRQRFGWSPTRYYHCLNRLIDLPAALAADPIAVKRLRRIRSRRGGSPA